MAAQVHLFRCLSDNYGVLLHDPSTGATASIDAPEAAPVEAALMEKGWRLSHILVTHHHGDHTAGILDLKARHRCKVTAPRAEAARIAGVDATVGEGDAVRVGSLDGRVIETPGHTMNHLAFALSEENALFSGDHVMAWNTSVVAPPEGNMADYMRSLDKLRTEGQLDAAWDRSDGAQSRRRARVDVLLAAGMPPAAAQSGVVLLVGAQHHGRRVVQETPESLAAESPIDAREQDEVMPQVVHHLRRHGDELAARAPADLEILPQPIAHQRLLPA